MKENKDLDRGLASKILLVMQDVTKIDKDKRNEFHKYNYASDEAVLTALRSSMIKNKLVALPNQVNCEFHGDMTTIKIEYTLLDVESGEKITLAVHGQGSDKGDKGAYKAATGAEKYFFLKTFMIPTGDDPEDNNGRPELITKEIPKPYTSTKQWEFISDKQAKRFYALCNSGEKTPEDIKSYLSSIHGIEDGRKLKPEAYDMACEWAQNITS